jgi:hypothetical protein
MARGDLGVLLRMARGAEEPDTEEQDGTEPPAAAEPGGQLIALQGGQMAWQEQARAAVQHGFRVAWLRARELQRREGGLVNGLMNAKPASVQEQCDYAKSRAWVPPGHDGGIAEKAGVIYHALIGRPGVAAGNAWSAVFARPLRLALALLIILVIILIVAIA